MTRRHAICGVGAVMLAAFACGATVGAVNRPSLPSQLPQRSPDSKPVALAAKPVDTTFDTKIKPFLTTYCNGCHNSTKQAGSVTLDAYLNESHAKKDRMTWEMIVNVVTSGEMPPKKKPQPSKDEKEAFLGWVENTMIKVDCTSPKDPGRVTLRRLNRAEYNNTIRDLCGVDFSPADDFPSEDVGYGFDNIGDVLSMQPVLLEKYLTAAEKVLDTAIVSLDGVHSSNQSFRPQTILVTPRSAKLREKSPKGNEIVRIVLAEEGSAFLEKFNFPADGEYYLRVKAWGEPSGDEAPKIAIRLDGKEAKSFTVDATEKTKAKPYEVKLKVSTGERRVAVAFTNPTADKKSRVFHLEAIEIEGPIGGGSKPLPESTKRILHTIPKTEADNKLAAKAVLTKFATRAYRRPVTADEVQRLLKLYDIAEGQGDPFEKAIRLPLKAILVSPNFLFRVEADPKSPEEVRTISDHEFATRLSYFLWSTMPDDTLIQLADAGELRNPGVLEVQVKRMLKDPKSKALVDNFAGQWLMLRNIRTLSPDTGLFPTWDEPLRNAIIKETELYFDYIVREDRSVLEFLDSDYTFANERLAKHYSLPNVLGAEFQKVKLTDNKRGGVITQASILLVTSNPTRTSPVKRGKWILDNILGTPPPPPAPDIPELPPVGELKGTLRQQMESHRSNPACATCHTKMDPLGFGLENFDAIGSWRELDNKQKIDPSGVLPGGAKFSGPSELRKILLGKSEAFRNCLSEKLLTYALGRGLEYQDKCAVNELSKKLTKGNDQFSQLVLAILETDAFQKRRGKRSE